MALHGPHAGANDGGQIELSKDKAGKFRFHLKAANGEIIAASQGYDTKAGCRKGLEMTPTKCR
ncbi:MAG: YegP family protein [Mycobacterium sp.]